MALSAASIRREGDPPRLGAQLGWLADEFIEPLRREKELGEAGNFSPLVESLKVIRTILIAYAWEDPRFEPPVLITEVNVHLTELRSVLNDAEALSPELTDSNSRQSLITRVDNERAWFAERVVPYIRADAIAGATAAAEATKSGEQAATDAETIRDLLSTLRRQAGEVGTESLAGYFQSAAKMYGILAIVSLIGAILAVAATVSVGWYFLIYDPIKVDLTQQSALVEYLRQLVPRLLLVGVVAYLIRFAVGNYEANMHLRVANEQRRNTLRTYPLLVASITTEWARDRAVLLLAQAAVTPFATGHLPGDKKEKGIESEVASLAETLIRRS